MAESDDTRLNIKSLIRYNMRCVNNRNRLNKDFRQKRGYVLVPVDDAKKWMKDINGGFVSEVFYLSKLEPEGPEYAIYKIIDEQPDKVKIAYYRGPVSCYEPEDGRPDLLEKYDNIPAIQARYFESLEKWANGGQMPLTRHVCMYSEKDYTGNEADPYKYTPEYNVIAEMYRKQGIKNNDVLIRLDEVADISEYIPDRQTILETDPAGSFRIGDIAIDMNNPKNITSLDDRSTIDKLDKKKKYAIVHVKDGGNMPFVYLYLKSQLLERLNPKDEDLSHIPDLIYRLSDLRIFKPGRKQYEFKMLYLADTSDDIHLSYVSLENIKIETKPKKLDDLLMNETLSNLYNNLYAFNADMVNEDYREMIDSYRNRDYKCCVTMAGCILETICLDVLYEQYLIPSLKDSLKQYFVNRKENEKCQTLAAYLEALKDNYLPPSLYIKGKKIKNMRNRIHPRVSAKEGRPTEKDCTDTISDLDKIIRYRFTMNEIENCS